MTDIKNTPQNVNKSPDKKDERPKKGKKTGKSGSAKEPGTSAGEGKGIGGTQISTEDSNPANEGKLPTRQVRDLG